MSGFYDILICSWLKLFEGPQVVPSLPAPRFESCMLYIFILKTVKILHKGQLIDSYILNGISYYDALIQWLSRIPSPKTIWKYGGEFSIVTMFRGYNGHSGDKCQGLCILCNIQDSLA